jgi:hypothetical protein
MQLFICRFEPQPDYLREINIEVVKFLGEMDAKLEQIKKMRGV